jgi:hypothetical protein
MFLGRNAAVYPVRMFVERCTDRIAKRIEIGAFFEPAKDAGPGATGTRKRAIQRTEHYHRDTTGRGLSAQNPADRKAVEVGQQQIHLPTRQLAACKPCR